MSALRNFLKRFFKEQKTENKVPFLHEPFDFDIYDDGYVHWLSSRAHLALSQLITDSFLKFSSKQEYQKGVHILSNPKMSGLALTCADFGFSKKDYIYLCTSIKSRLLNDGYVLQLSEIKSKNENSNIKQTIKCYLKPSRKRVRNGKNEQIYGNISLEINSLNEKLNQFKISCSYYQDQHFHEPVDFNIFLENNLLQG